MSWLTENWIWFFFGVAFIAMHLFGHGGHGRHGGGGCGHGSHGSGSAGDADADRTPVNKGKANPPSVADGSRPTHRH